MSEKLCNIIPYIGGGRASKVDAELGKKVNTADIVDNLTSTDTDKPLSAAQGNALQGTIANVTNYLSNSSFVYVTVVSTKTNTQSPHKWEVTIPTVAGFKCISAIVTHAHSGSVMCGAEQVSFNSGGTIDGYSSQGEIEVHVYLTFIRIFSA